jgi:hypothetical protein
MAHGLSKIAFQDFRILLYKDIDILERKQVKQLPLLELVLYSTHASLHKLTGLAHSCRFCNTRRQRPFILSIGARFNDGTIREWRLVRHQYPIGTCI